MIEVGLVASRWLHFFATTAAFGLALFRLYAPRTLLDARCAGFVLSPLAGLAIASGLGWFYFATASMLGDAAAVPSNLSTIFTQTDFGPLWAARLVVATLLCFPFANRRVLPALCLSGLLLASLALTGHTRTNPGALGLLHVAADILHLLCAGAWLGALAAFVILLWRAPRDPETARALTNFAVIGTLAVAGLVLSGLINGWLVLGAIGPLWTSNYGRLLVLKLALFIAMLALAASNRFRVAPSLAASVEPKTVRTMSRHVAFELALGSVVLFTVSLLGTMDPVE